jgi:hypothetical protein
MGDLEAWLRRARGPARVLVLPGSCEHLLPRVIAELREAGCREVLLVRRRGEALLGEASPGVEVVDWPAGEEREYALDLGSLRAFRRLPADLALILSSAERVGRADLYTLFRPMRRVAHLCCHADAPTWELVTGARYRLRLLTAVSGQLLDCILAVLLFAAIQSALALRHRLGRARG